MKRFLAFEKKDAARLLFEVVDPGLLGVIKESSRFLWPPVTSRLLVEENLLGIPDELLLVGTEDRRVVMLLLLLLLLLLPLEFGRLMGTLKKELAPILPFPLMTAALVYVLFHWLLLFPLWFPFDGKKLLLLPSSFPPNPEPVIWPFSSTFGPESFRENSLSDR